MDEQVSAHTRARKTDPVTSHRAAESIAPRVSALQKIVLEEIRRAGPNGLTDEELTERVGLHGSTARTRRSELVDAGKVVDGKRKRPLASGRLGVVWVAADLMEGRLA